MEVLAAECRALRAQRLVRLERLMEVEILQIEEQRAYMRALRERWVEIDREIEAVRRDWNEHSGGA
jgi:hypothetical protein